MRGVPRRRARRPVGTSSPRSTRPTTMAGRVGGQPAQGEGAELLGASDAPIRQVRHAEQHKSHAEGGHDGAGDVEVRVAAGGGRAGDEPRAAEHYNEVGRHDGEGEPEARRIHDDAQDQGRERRKGGRAGDGAERDGALPSLVERRDQAEHRGRDQADAESRDNAPAPGEREDGGGERRRDLSQRGQGEADGQCAPQADRHADEPAGDHERAGDEREQRGRHLDVVEGGAQSPHQARRGEVHRRAVTRGADLGESENDQGRVRRFRRCFRSPSCALGGEDRCRHSEPLNSPRRRLAPSRYLVVS